MADIHDPLLARIALSRAKGMRAPTVRQIMDVAGDPCGFFAMSAAELHRMTGAKAMVYEDAYRTALLQEAQAETTYVRTAHIDTMFLTDDGYPRRLSECEDAPVMLYRTGSCDLDARYVVGIVGTRHATAYGIDFTSHLVADLARMLPGVVIVSGLAYGIDVAAHKAALAAGTPTVGVVAHGLNMIYPAQHRDVAARMVAAGGAVITEYSTDVKIHRSNFLERNRIVAGLCDCLVVVESDKRGGSLSTARLAMQYNRDVFALPGRATDRMSSGTNRLIANNTAALITCADDLVRRMGWQAENREHEEAPTLFRTPTPDEEAVIAFIKENTDATVNDICVGLGRSYAAVSAMLFQMEMDDMVVTMPGGRYITTI